MPPLYLHLDLPKHVMRNVSRFCKRAHTLAVKETHGCSCLCVSSSFIDVGSGFTAYIVPRRGNGAQRRGARAGP